MSGFLLDTNIPSEVLRPRPDQAVAAWLEGQPQSSLYVSVVTLAELRKGAALLDPGEKRAQIERAMAALIPAWFQGRILPVTQAVAERCGVLEATRQRAGRPLGIADAMIAATALEHDLTLVTRNIKDFEQLGASLLDPWKIA